MAKTPEQLQEKQRKILRRAKQGMEREQKQKKEQRKKTYSNIRKSFSKKLKLPKKKVYGYSQQLSNRLRNLGYAPSSQSQSNRPVGRPRAVFKHRDPATGKPIPATLYYKRVKEFKRLAQQRARQEDLQAVQQLARKGIPPQQAQQIVDQRQLQSVGVRQVTQQDIINERLRQIQSQERVQQIQAQPRQNSFNPRTYIPIGQPVAPQNQTIWGGRRGMVTKDAGLFGPREIVVGLPESFWN